MFVELTRLYFKSRDISLLLSQKIAFAAMDAFQVLVDDIKTVLGPSSGLDSEDVEVEDLTHLMERYMSKAEEWAPYALSNANMPYTRNLVDEGNGKANLVRLPPVPIGSLPCRHANTVVWTARPCLDSREKQPYPRPRECSLLNEDPAR